MFGQFGPVKGYFEFVVVTVGRMVGLFQLVHRIVVLYFGCDGYGTAFFTKLESRYGCYCCLVVRVLWHLGDMEYFGHLLKGITQNLRHENGSGCASSPIGCLFG